MKTIFKRFVIGSFIGISISHLISLIISIILGHENYQGASPQLIASFGNEINAMVVQTLASMVLGGVFSAASYVFDRTYYSITKQTIIHFLITTPVYLAISYYLGWSSKSLKGFLLTLIIYTFIYIVIWLTVYLYWKQKVAKLNNDIKKYN